MTTGRIDKSAGPIPKKDRWAIAGSFVLLLGLLYAFIGYPIQKHIEKDKGPGAPGTTDCKVTAYQPYGNLPALTPMNVRTCSKDGDNNYLLNKLKFNDLQYKVVTGFICNDGTRSSATTGQGACSYHRGIRSTIYFNTKTGQTSVY